MYKDFQRDTANHSMQVLRDDGVYRHIRFSDNGSSVYRFDLLTWPGCLCYTGDMGTFVFQRLEDMFEFFRDGRERRVGEEPRINRSYWSEKLIAVDGSRRNGSAEEFSEEKFRRVINEYRVDWVRREVERAGSALEALNKEKRRELWEAVQDQMLDLLDEGYSDGAQRAAFEFVWRDGAWGRGKPEWSFTDLFERNFTDYTHAFTWCCYAIAWGIEQYDDQKQDQTETAL